MHLHFNLLGKSEKKLFDRNRILRVEELGCVQDEIIDQSRGFLIPDRLNIGVVYPVLSGIRHG